MKKEFKVKEIPQCLKQTKIGEGANANCYITTSGRLYKELKGEGIDDYITKQLLDYKYPGLAFPEQIIYLNDKLKGFLRDVVEGTKVSDLDLTKTDISDFLIAMMVFENQLKEFSYDTGLSLYEINNNNLIYTKDKRLVNIDTDNTQPFDYLGYTVGNPFFENMKEFANSIAPILLTGNFKSRRLNQLQKECILGGYMRPSTFVSEALEKMDHFIDVKTISDYQKGLTLLRK